MTMRPNTIFVLASLMNVWKLGKGVEILSCPSSSVIQIGPTTTTFQFGDGSTPYDTILSCSWIFTASDSSASLVIGQNLKCGDGDKLEITNVNSGAAKQVTCCPDCTKAPEITGNTARIAFTSDSNQTAEDIGFSFEIFAAIDDSGCTRGNNTFNIPISSPYFITSPNFPGYYPRNIECRYTFIPVPPSLGLVISFQFIHLDYELDCYDQIILKEGDMNGNQIAKICQRYSVTNPIMSPNETYRSKGPLFLHFSSDSMISARGFRACVQQDLISKITENTTTLVTDSTTKKNTTPITIAESTTISTTDSRSTTSESSTSTLAKVRTANNSPFTMVTESNTRSTLPSTTEITTQTSSTTTSKVETLKCPSSSFIQIGSTTTTYQFGDGRTPYDRVLSCTWTFTASNLSASLVIGQKLKCGIGDILEITNVNSGAAKIITCCSDCTKAIEITGNTARITFTSDSNQTAEDIGFSFEIFAAIDDSGCTGGNNTFNIPISSPYFITSPNFPGYYPNNIECRYTFTPVPASLGLVISFQFINLDYYAPDCYDKIILKEGDINGNQIAKICQGYPVSSPVISPNETYRTKGPLFLHFVSDGMEQGRGFSASVQQDPISVNTESTTALANESTTKKSTTHNNNSPLTTVTESNTRSTLPSTTEITTQTSPTTTSKDTMRSATAESSTISTTSISTISQISKANSPLTTVTESNTLSTLPSTKEITTYTSSTTTTSNVLKDATQSTTAQSATVSTTSKSTTSQISASTLTKGIPANNSSLTTVKESNTRSTLPTSTEILTRTSSITTSKVSGCSKTILNGNLINCHSRIGDTCRFECKGPLENNPSVPNITCNLNGFWNYDTNDLCLTLCKSEIKNGKLEFNCERKIGNKCSFVCETGYVSTIFSSNIVCTSDRIWNENIDELCKENGIEDDDGPYVYIGSTIAATAVIILVVAIVWKFCLKQRNASGNNYQTSFVDREHNYMEIGNPGYSTGNNRSGMQEPVEYATIDDQSITGYEEPKSYKYTYSNAVFSS